MKTSNKLLFSAGAGLVMAFISFLISFRTNLETFEHVKIAGDGIQTIEIRINQIKSDAYYLNGDFEYQLDPNNTNASINGETNIIALIEIKESESGLIVGWKDRNVEIKKNLPIVITLGTGDKKALDLHIDDNAKLRSLDKLDFEMFQMRGSDNAKCTLDIQATTAIFNLKNNCELDIQGQVTTVDVALDDNAKLIGLALDAGTATINLKHNSEFALQTATYVIGELNGNSKLHFGGDDSALRTRERDNSTVNKL